MFPKPGTILKILNFTKQHLRLSERLGVLEHSPILLFVVELFCIKEKSQKTERDRHTRDNIDTPAVFTSLMFL